MPPRRLRSLVLRLAALGLALVGRFLSLGNEAADRLRASPDLQRLMRDLGLRAQTPPPVVPAPAAARQ